MKILVVEDEPKTRAYLRQGLTEAGYVSDLVPNTAQTGCIWLCKGEYDLVILDVMLPGLNGWQVLQSCATVALDARPVPDRPRPSGGSGQKGWSLGRMITLSSPSRSLGLLARVRIILRRGHAGNEGTMLKVADLELDLLRRRVSRNGKRVDFDSQGV